MYINSLSLMDELKDYASPRAKITRMIQSGDLTQVRRGIYVGDEAVSGRVLANVVYGPSYLSFEYALSFHGLIPESVRTFTSAAFRKNKTKIFDTALGIFQYFPVPDAVYPYSLQRILDDEAYFLIASPEKALCDTLSKLKPVGSNIELTKLVYENLRIGREDFINLDGRTIDALCPRYGRTNLNRLMPLWKKEKGNA